VHPYTNYQRLSVAALGEEKLITAIRGWLGTASPRAPFGIGDDCAVIPGTRGPQLITVDPVIHGRHFDDRVPPAQVGAKLLKRNLSDLAAMGGTPTAAVLALTLDARVSVRWLEQFYRGLAAAARQYGVAIVGGDVAQADQVLAASLTLLGRAAASRVVTRTGARIGDHLFVTGELGGSLQSGHHVSFEPRLAEGTWLARRRDVVAMMDVSDGLAKDLHALTPPGAQPVLFAEQLPRRGRATEEEALTDGEDYELVFAVRAQTRPERLLADWHRAFPEIRLTRIGEMMREGSRPADAIDLAKLRGYEHLGAVRSHPAATTAARCRKRANG
jgi:thiamine-monophosphate kinase